MGQHILGRRQRGRVEDHGVRVQRPGREEVLAVAHALHPSERVLLLELVDEHLEHLDALGLGRHSNLEFVGIWCVSLFMALDHRAPSFSGVKYSNPAARRKDYYTDRWPCDVAALLRWELSTRDNGHDQHVLLGLHATPPFPCV